MPRKCTPSCRFFRCGKRALKIYRAGRNVIAYCTWTQSPCIGTKCKFAMCVKDAILPDGTCGLELRRLEKKVEEFDEELEKEVKAKSTKVTSKLKKYGISDEDIE